MKNGDQRRHGTGSSTPLFTANTEIQTVHRNAAGTCSKSPQRLSPSGSAEPSALPTTEGHAVPAQPPHNRQHPYQSTEAARGVVGIRVVRALTGQGGFRGIWREPDICTSENSIHPARKAGYRINLSRSVNERSGPIVNERFSFGF